mmetsp:Transcript_19538/g.24116  ORF Transcript_19538/g.24116 Transcript_19538/m.24116 type:complete len:335 (+) Transcript_19538:30-1034(+)
MAFTSTQNEGINNHDNEGHPSQGSVPTSVNLRLTNGYEYNSLTDDDNKSNDCCCGNEKIRNTMLSLILIGFAGLDMSPTIDSRKFYVNMDGDDYLCNDIYPCQSFVNAYTIIWGALQMYIAAGIYTIIGLWMNYRYSKRVGFILIFIGICYFVGQCWYLGSYVSFSKEFTGLDRRILDANVTYYFGEALLPSMIAVILGLDLWIHVMQDLGKRLFINLIAIFIVGGICAPSSYYVYANEKNNPQYIQTNALMIIAIGYIILFAVSLVYIISYIIYRNALSKCFMKVIGIALIVGGIVIFYGNMSDNYGLETYAWMTLVFGYSLIWGFDSICVSR